MQLSAGEGRTPRGVVVIGGSVGFNGAPVLAANAAVRSGAEAVAVGLPRGIWKVASKRLTGAASHPLPDDANGRLTGHALEGTLALLGAAAACLIGPGLGRGEGAESLVHGLLRAADCPVVLDADGINALEGHIDSLDERRGRLTVLTPHDVEFMRLSGALPGSNRAASARAFAAAHSCVLVLKGHRTVTAFPNGETVVNETGNPGMATGGSGDVLAGVLLALLGEGLPARQAVPLGVTLHGRAGDVCAEELGEYGMLPSDLIARLPLVRKEWMEQEGCRCGKRGLPRQ